LGWAVHRYWGKHVPLRALVSTRIASRKVAGSAGGGAREFQINYPTILAAHDHLGVVLCVPRLENLLPSDDSDEL